MEVPSHFSASVSAMEDTGERMIPERSDSRTFWEHVYRYRFACGFAVGKRVLDIACGEGYGSAALVKCGAAQVIGMDVSSEAVEHARGKYGIDARLGDAQAIALPSDSVDLVVSFETIEHLPEPELFLDEARRVLAPGGLLIVSTPNRWVYDQLDVTNRHHCSEMYQEQFRGVVSARFSRVEWHSQLPYYAPWWSRRSLNAERSQWFDVHGPWRLRDLARKVMTPEIFGPVLDGVRGSITDRILATDRVGASIWNPYLVRPYRAGHQEQPWYYLAVATCG